MRFLNLRLSARAGVIAVALGAGTSGLAPPVFASPSAATAAPVSPLPASGTPALVLTPSQQTVRQIVQCGSTMYAAGDFWSITQSGVTYHRAGVFSFSATPPYTLTALNAKVSGEVDSIAFVPQQGCGDAYIGGSFTAVHGTPATDIAEISTTTGAVVPAFGRDANGTVETLVGYGNHLLAGGEFTETNGHARSYYASLNPVTGKDDGFLRMRVHARVDSAREQIYNQQLSHGGTLLLAEGNFNSIGGQPRQQIAMINLATDPATLTAWTSPEFSQHCVSDEPFYVRTAAWSPDDSTVYIATTGEHPLHWGGSFPLTGLCDSVAAFPATQTSVSHTWVTYSGCDSYYSVAGDTGAVYAAGHPRWADNPDGCDYAGPGAIQDYGLQGYAPGDGTLETSGGSPVYSMSRANGDSMLITSAGLWIASSNRFRDNQCGGVSGHSGICLLPYQ